MVNERESMEGVDSTGGFSIVGSHGGGHGGGHRGGGHRSGGRRRGGGGYVAPVVLETDTIDTLDAEDDGDDDSNTILVRRRRVL
jgi:hypothetical protein